MKYLIAAIPAALTIASASAAAEGIGPILVDHESISVSGNGHKHTFACNGRKLIVEGSDHVIVATGVCSQVEVWGGKNTVTAEVSPKGRLMVAGADHVVNWKSSGEPEQDISGADNKVKKIR